MKQSNQPRSWTEVYRVKMELCYLDQLVHSHTHILKSLKASGSWIFSSTTKLPSPPTGTI